MSAPEPTFPDLRAFLDRLRRDRDLVEVDAAVDPRLELAEIHRRVIAAGGPALLFTRVRGSRFPVATNLFGTPRRAGLAFGSRPLRLIRASSSSLRSCCRRRRRGCGAPGTSAASCCAWGRDAAPPLP